ARLPEVLADRRADQGLAVLEQKQVASRREVAVLVEDAVVREEAFPVDGLDLAARANGASVVEVAVEVGEADEGGQPARVAGELAQGLRRGTDEARPQQQVLRRVAGDRQLGEEDDVSPGGARLVQAL